MHPDAQTVWEKADHPPHRSSQQTYCPACTNMKTPIQPQIPESTPTPAPFDNVESKQQNENKFDKFVVPKWKYCGITLQRQSSFILEKAFTCTRHTCMPLRFMHSSLTLFF